MFTACDVESPSNFNYDTVYISVGANDVFMSNGTLTYDQLYDKIEAAVLNIATNLIPGASRYVMTGYCNAIDPYYHNDWVEPSDFIQIEPMSVELFPGTNNPAIWTILNSVDKCGGDIENGEWSDPFYFQDILHLNSKGYCKLFDVEAQEALMCDDPEQVYDCDELDFEIYGEDQLCDPRPYLDADSFF